MQRTERQRWRRFLPRGNTLAPHEWAARHRGIILLLWCQAGGLAIFGLIRGFGLLHSLVEASFVAATAALTQISSTPRRVRALIATFGLLSSSAILVHLSGGMIEAHFHFFVMITLITLYQSWWPFLLSVAYVVIHHGLIGVLDADSVYNHGAAIRSPIIWALIHGFFILGASIAGLIVWKRSEDLRDIQADLNRHHALLLNDDVIQGLAVAKMAAELGESGTSEATLRSTLLRAQEIATELMEDLNEGRGPKPGDLMRDPSR